IDKYTVRVCTKASDDTRSCDESKNKPIFSNFLELIGIKIIPEHRIKDINSATVNTSIPELYRSPVGTGRYKFIGADDYSVTIEFNDDYYLPGAPQINQIRFRYYRNLEEAVEAMQNGEVHLL